MIRVTVELLPGGDAGRARHLGTAYIANDGTGTETTGSYSVMLSRRGMPWSIWKRGRVQGFPRKRLLAWDLLYRALDGTVGHRNRKGGGF